MGQNDRPHSHHNSAVRFRVTLAAVLLTSFVVGGCQRLRKLLRRDSGTDVSTQVDAQTGSGANTPPPAVVPTAVVPTAVVPTVDVPPTALPPAEIPPAVVPPDPGVPPPAAPPPAVPPPAAPPPAAPPPAAPSVDSSVLGASLGTMVTADWTPAGFVATDVIAVNMVERARRYALGYSPVTGLTRSALRQSNAGVIVPGTVQAGFCYRIIAVSEPGIRDLDLMLYDPSGRTVDSDRAPDNSPVIGLNRPLCIPPGSPPNNARLRVRAFSGSGAIGVQVFARPFAGN